MAEFNPEPVHVPGCVPAELRRALEPVANLVSHIVEGDTITIDVTSVSGDTITELHDAGELTGALPPAVFASGSSYAEATLSAALRWDATPVVISGKTFNPKFVRENFQLPTGSLIGGIWNGTNYSIIAWNKCEEAAV